MRRSRRFCLRVSRVSSDFGGKRVELLAQHAGCAEDADFDEREGYPGGRSDVFVGGLLDESERGDKAIFWREAGEGGANAFAHFARDGRVGRRWCEEIVGQGGFVARFAEMIERDVGCNAMAPGGEVAVGSEESAGAINAPEGFHG